MKHLVFCLDKTGCGMNRVMTVVMFGFLLLVSSAKGQEAGRPPTLANPKLVYQLRKSGWTTALEMLPNLEQADKENSSGILAFSADVRRVEKSIDSTKPKKLHDSKIFDAAIKIYEDVLSIWPQSSVAQYELGYSKRMSKSDPSTHFENCRRLDPFNMRALRGKANRCLKKRRIRRPRSRNHSF